MQKLALLALLGTITMVLVGCNGEKADPQQSMASEFAGASKDSNIASSKSGSASKATPPPAEPAKK